LDFIYVSGNEGLQKLQKAVTSMQRDIFNYGGTVRQFLVDDKGSVLIGVFGTPPDPHEDDGSRAIMASVRLQKNLNESLSIQCRIGVTTGHAFVGDVGNQ